MFTIEKYRSKELTFYNITFEIVAIPYNNQETNLRSRVNKNPNQYNLPNFMKLFPYSVNTV